ncbi:hypothetical protein F4777DRAFT_572916 [Nemania sp. FL0916]|nr:hypothetical protein F4777DRAFT_572916 [Nemania sp. FL0916]
MAFELFRDPFQGAIFVLCLVAIPITSLVTLLRLLNAARSREKINIEDWFTLVALLSFLFHAGVALWNVIDLNGTGRFGNAALAPWRLVRLAKVGYVQSLNFPVNPTAAKLSLLALYHRIFRVNRIYRKWVWLLAVLQVLWFFAVLIVRILICTPPQKLWDPTTPGTCIDPSLLLAAGEAINAAIAFAMVFLAMFMVRSLAMSNTTKWKLRVLFFLGGLTGVIDIILIATSYGNIQQNLTYLLLLTIQMFVNTICCCAPVYRSIFPTAPWLRKLTSNLLLYHYWSKTSGKSDNISRPTFITIGGTVKKGVHHDQDWIHLNDSSAPVSGWADTENTADVRAQTPGSDTKGANPESIRVQRTFEVA